MKGNSFAGLVLVAWAAWLLTVVADTGPSTSALSTSVSSSSDSSAGSNTAISTISSIAAQLTEVPTDTRATYSSAETTSTAGVSTNGTAGLHLSNQTAGTASLSSSSAVETLLRGSGTTSGSTSSPTDISARCNGHAELCERKYSNVTYVVAHNSPFHVAHNAASNQDFDVTTQLDNGIRGIQSETHYYQDDVHLCHTSCDELNAGTLEAYLITVKQWLDNNRYEVITIILGNEDFIDPGNYTAPFTNAGLLEYLYLPTSQPMDIDGWPTLADMIITNKRVVAMLAHDADQQKIPWLLDLWSYQWQTPFSPTNASFPCTVQRPPGQDRATSQKRLYLANHNLNVDISLSAGSSSGILVPDVVQLDSTNANDTVFGSAQLAVQHCTEDWGRPPNVLPVDYYNRGNSNGSALAVVAEANDVAYDASSCYGSSASVESVGIKASGADLLTVSFAAASVTFAALMLQGQSWLLLVAISLVQLM